MLQLRHLDGATQRRPTHAHERVVDHAAHDDRTDGVVEARLGAEREHADAPRIDVVREHEAQRRSGSHRVDVFVGRGHAERVTDDGGQLRRIGGRPLGAMLSRI